MSIYFFLIFCLTKSPAVSYYFLSAHSFLGQALLLSLIHISRVAGGTVCLGADGRPNGILEENASYQAIAKLPATSFEETRKNMLRAVQMCIRDRLYAPPA